MNRSIASDGKYVWIWEKYRPVILRLMIASSEEPQEYKLSKHEFVDSNNKRPTGYSFVLNAYQSKSENDLKSLVAQDLLYILKSSQKAGELMKDASYEFKMDKNFMLKISSEVKQVSESE